MEWAQKKEDAMEEENIEYTINDTKVKQESTLTAIENDVPIYTFVVRNIYTGATQKISLNFNDVIQIKKVNELFQKAHDKYYSSIENSTSWYKELIVEYNTILHPSVFSNLFNGTGNSYIDRLYKSLDLDSTDRRLILRKSVLIILILEMFVLGSTYNFSILFLVRIWLECKTNSVDLFRDLSSDPFPLKMNEENPSIKNEISEEAVNIDQNEEIISRIIDYCVRGIHDRIESEFDNLPSFILSIRHLQISRELLIELLILTKDKAGFSQTKSSYNIDNSPIFSRFSEAPTILRSDSFSLEKHESSYEVLKLRLVIENEISEMTNKQPYHWASIYQKLIEMKVPYSLRRNRIICALCYTTDFYWISKYSWAELCNSLAPCAEVSDTILCNLLDVLNEKLSGDRIPSECLLQILSLNQYAIEEKQEYLISKYIDSITDEKKLLETLDLLVRERVKKNFIFKLVSHAVSLIDISAEEFYCFAKHMQPVIKIIISRPEVLGYLINRYVPYKYQNITFLKYMNFVDPSTINFDDQSNFKMQALHLNYMEEYMEAVSKLNNASEEGLVIAWKQILADILSNVQKLFLDAVVLINKISSDEVFISTGNISYLMELLTSVPETFADSLKEEFIQFENLKSELESIINRNPKVFEKIVTQIFSNYRFACYKDLIQEAKSRMQMNDIQFTKVLLKCCTSDYLTEIFEIIDSLYLSSNLPDNIDQFLVLTLYESALKVHDLYGKYSDKLNNLVFKSLEQNFHETLFSLLVYRISDRDSFEKLLEHKIAFNINSLMSMYERVSYLDFHDLKPKLRKYILKHMDKSKLDSIRQEMDELIIDYYLKQGTDETDKLYQFAQSGAHKSFFNELGDGLNYFPEIKVTETIQKVEKQNSEYSSEEYYSSSSDSYY